MSAETEHVLEILAQKLIESLTPGRDTIRECVRGLWSHLRSAGMRGQDLMTAQSFLIRIAEEAHIPWMDIDTSFRGEGSKKPAGGLMVKRRK